MNFKTGKLDPVRKPTHVSLTDHLDVASAIPSVPAQGWEFAVPQSELSVLGNDVYGCCAPAGAYGLAQIMTCNTDPSDPIVPTTGQVLDLYNAVTGFTVNDPSSDQGTVVTDLLDHWKKHGFPVTTRSGKKRISQIAGWAALDISNFNLLRWAAYTFGGSLLGIKCPQKCIEDTTNWNFAPGLPLAGGHLIVQAGEGSLGGKMRSWGMFIPSTAGFMGAYNDEGYIVATPEWINAQGVSPVGLNLNSLLAAMKAA